MTHTHAHDPALPIAPASRSTLLDGLRGVALLGIMLVNMTWFTGFAVLDGDARAALGTERLDAVTAWLVHFAIDGKFWSLFALLFGAGFAMQLQRSGGRVRGRLAWRMGVLFAIGLAHAVVLWFGDIVSLYAVVGFALFLFARSSNSTVLKAAVVLLLSPILLSGIFLGIELLLRSGEAPGDPGHGPAALLVYFGHGSLAEVLRANWAFLVERWFLALYTGRFCTLLGMFLLGLYAGRCGVLVDPRRHAALLRRVLIWGLFVGVPANALLASWHVPLRPPSGAGWIAGVVRTIGTPALCLAWTASLLFMLSSPLARRFLVPFALTGRMSLTNYLMQSVIGISIFYGYGLGHWGAFGITWSLVMITAIFIALAAASAVWLNFFSYGPVEWGWRCLTYRRVLPLRSTALGSPTAPLAVSRSPIRGSMPAILVATLIVPAIGATPIPEAEWHAWRGPNHDGTIDATEHFDSAAIGLRAIWRQPLRSAYSGIAVSRELVLTMHTDGHSDLLVAFDVASGAERWRYTMGPMYEAHDGAHDGPLSTPVIAHDMVFALGASGRLVAVGLRDGAERWSAALPEVTSAPDPFWGFATTPLVAGDVVVVQTGAPRGRGLIALDASSGEIRWSVRGGAVDYRSPILSTLAGVAQIVACFDNETLGVAPSSGAVLWRLPGPTKFSSTPVPVGEDRLLLHTASECAMYRIGPDGEQPTQLWRTNEFGGNHGTPVPFDGHLYGFSGRLLTCLDDATGTRRWRSRSPGGKGLIIVDGHLVIFGSRGEVVVAAASPLGYRERARLPVSDANGYAAPAFADGVIYVRNMHDLVAIATTGDAPAAATRASSSNFETFVRSLAADPDKATRLDTFMAAQPSFPIVEAGRLVHFVYRGPAHDVAIEGSMLAAGEQDALHRVANTDFYHRSYAIEPGARWEYRLAIDFRQPRPDPLNPRRASGPGGMSEVVTPGWNEPSFAPGSVAADPDRLEPFAFDSTIFGARRHARVYLPLGYDASEKRYPLVVVTEGDEWIDHGRLPAIVDHLTGNGADPSIVVFVDASGGSYRELGGHRTRDYAGMLARELVPGIDRRYRTRAAREHRVVLGKRAAAVAATYAALTYPDVFGHCVAISYGRADTVRARAIATRMAQVAGPKPRFVVAWNRYDVWRPQSFDVRDQSRGLAVDLERHGFEVVSAERLDAAGWRSWRILAGDALLRVSCP